MKNPHGHNRGAIATALHKSLAAGRQGAVEAGKLREVFQRFGLNDETAAQIAQGVRNISGMKPNIVGEAKAALTAIGYQAPQPQA